jgi:hypothetical protein
MPGLPDIDSKIRCRACPMSTVKKQQDVPRRAAGNK